jgi:2-alkyl-3-oxoalkanoate reductase
LRVFVAGASGAIGRPLVPKLVAAGHEVTGMTRSEERAGRIREAGAAAAVLDVFDRDALTAAVTGARTEVVVSELTSLPERLDYRSSDTMAATNRVRTAGTANLIDAARTAGAHRFICQSIAFRTMGDAARAVADMEAAVTGAEGIDGLVLRYGQFYGPGTYYGEGGFTTRDVRRRRMAVVGKGTGVVPFIHVDDAADATVAAVERGAPGVYDIVDDEPAAMRDWLPVFAKAAGAPKPFRVPVWVARLVVGREAAAAAVGVHDPSNEKAKRELGWMPAHPSWRTGFAQSFERT